MMDFLIIYGIAVTWFVVILAMEWRKLRKKAYQDFTTGLFNRYALQQYKKNMKNGITRGLIYIDLDNFKGINDSYGHHIGDMILQEVGNRLKELTNEQHYFFRVGGDEFLLLTEGCSAATVRDLAKQVVELLNEPIVTEEKNVIVSGSVGISFTDINSAQRFEGIIEQAEQAMYQAKGNGKNQFDFLAEQFVTRDHREDNR
ncbi:GGDEF domain-containing protein [Gracilibacillus timonensis]|uniref:GGDEF domain-containing protein n=1 Tax=Gracilibacillus timonensis TaxID=1816696 RepID=UPI000824A0FB|nr:GGDEF domain-containing protein [Gracilibacillus timonensis]